MKAALLSLLLLLNGFIFAQEWEPFVLNQRSCYIAYDTSIIVELLADKQTGVPEKKQLHFYSQPSYTAPINCLSQIDSFNRTLDVTLGQDSLIITTDKLYFFNSIVPNDTFFILRHAMLGESWNIPISDIYADVDTINVRYDSTGVTSIFGITDSVKYYSLHTDNPQDNPLSLDHVQLILSKNYGFIKFVPIRLLLLGRNEYFTSYPFYTLNGFSFEEDTVGIHIPAWNEFVQLQPGDVLKFKTDYNYNINYTVWTVTDVVKDATTITVNYITDYGYSEEVKLYYNALQYALPYRGGVYMTAPVEPEGEESYDEYSTWIAFMDDWQIDTMRVLGEWTMSKTFINRYGASSDYCTVSEYMGYGTNYTIDSYLGLIAYANGDYDNHYSRELVGSIISGHASGNFWNVSVEQIDNNQTIAIHPNPVTAEILINSTYINDQYTIYSVTGFKVATGILQNNTISIPALTPGLYVLEISNQSGISTGRFVKL